MKVALVHEWLNDWAGSEQVVAGILRVLPQADVFALVDFLTPDDRLRLGNRNATTSFIQRMPFARRRMEFYLPLMPLAVEQFDLSGYDLVVSSSHAVAKGVITGPDQLHLSYVHSPMRYAWDLQHQYLSVSRLGKGLRGIITRLLLHYLRIWDVRTVNGVDRFACNSAFIARRIRKCYGRSATVIHPPVAVDGLPYRSQKEDFYLVAARLMPYKRVDLVVDAFRLLPERRLVIIGSGPERARLERGCPANVSFLGYVDDSELHGHLSRARAFLFAAIEDFGILPVEAQACGTPVIAFRKGGVIESVRDLGSEKPTGVLFDEQSSASLLAAVRRFEALEIPIDPADCRENAMQFSPQRFQVEFSEWLKESLAAHAAATGGNPGTPLGSLVRYKHVDEKGPER